jgi:hypothetical protein
VSVCACVCVCVCVCVRVCVCVCVCVCRCVNTLLFGRCEAARRALSRPEAQAALQDCVCVLFNRCVRQHGLSFAAEHCPQAAEFAVLRAWILLAYFPGAIVLPDHPVTTAAGRLAAAFESICAALVDVGGPTLPLLPSALTAGFPQLAVDYLKAFGEWRATCEADPVRVLLLDCLRAKARFANDPETLARLGQREEELRAMLRGQSGGAAVEAAVAFAIAEDARLTASFAALRQHGWSRGRMQAMR